MMLKRLLKLNLIIPNSNAHSRNLGQFFSIVETFKLCPTNHKITQNYRRVEVGMDLWKSSFVSLNYKGFLLIFLIFTFFNPLEVEGFFNPTPYMV